MSNEQGDISVKKLSLHERYYIKKTLDLPLAVMKHDLENYFVTEMSDCSETLKVLQCILPETHNIPQK